RLHTRNRGCGTDGFHRRHVGRPRGCGEAHRHDRSRRLPRTCRAPVRGRADGRRLRGDLPRSVERGEAGVMLERPAEGAIVDDEYSIRASSEVADIPKLVLKHDDAFLVANQLGDVPGIPDGAFGFYASDTRFLQRLELRVEGRRPVLLNATID